MKRKLITALILSSLALSVIFVKKNNPAILLKATSDEVLIGKRAITEEVNTRTKVYISLNNKAFIESTGRTVFTENSIGDIEPPEPLSDICSLGRIRYYYYADQNCPKILEIKTIKNNVESLTFMLQQLENSADAYGLYGSAKIDAILGYIRSISRSYSNNLDFTGFAWANIAGPININFNNYIESNATYNNGLSFLDYFASFTSSSDFNYDDHAIPGYTYLNNNFDLIDPISLGKIDLIHMFACIDGLYYFTIPDDYIVMNIGQRQFDLISWAGDLQQEINYICVNNIDYSAFNDWLDIMNHQNTHFSENDLLSDVDSFNIVFNLFELTSISQVVARYYETTSITFRYYSFITKIINRYLINGLDTFNQMKYVVYMFVGISYNYENYSISDINSDLIIYYAIMNKNCNPNPSFSLRKRIADLFLDYLDIYIEYEE